MKLRNVLNYKISNTNWNYKTCFIILFVMIAVGALIVFIVQPQVVKLVIKYLCILKPGRFLRNKHESKQQLSYKLFLWNVTNPKEITAGTAKPKLQEIGPYVFTQFKQKIGSSDNETEDSFSFDSWNVYYFDHQLSAPLTGDEMLTLLNPVLVGALVKVKLERPSFIDVAVESMESIFNSPPSIFITMSGMDFIENGIQIDCNRTEYAAKAACAEMRRNKMLKIMNADRTLLRFRWFDRLNDSVQARYTVKRGSKNLKDIGNIVGVNSEPMLKVFKDDPRCNVFNGTDKTIFPPLQRKNEIVWTYSNDACKSFPLRFRYKKTLRNIRTAFKNAFFTDPLVHPSCNCNKYMGCGYNGTIDLYPCTSLFLSASPPHYYLAESTVRQSVEGMNPKEHLHQSGTFFELLSGAPIYALERGQINILVKRIPEYHIFSSIADDIWFPFLWYEESFMLKNADLNFIKFVMTCVKLLSLVGYLLFSIGVLGGFVAGAFLIHHHVTVKPEVSDETPKK